MFDYKTSTKQAYKSPHIAEHYHRSFAGPTALLRFKIVAYFEKRAVATLLSVVDAKRVLDIPCGTGKLAPILASHCQSITAADISQEMLEIARATYADTGRGDIQFAVVDAENLAPAFSNAQLDTVVCLRLMHRVPSETRRRMLRQIATISPYAIVSFGVDSSYFRLRRQVRNWLLGGGTDQLCTASRDELLSEISENFHVMQARWVLRFVSEEIVYLLRRK